MSNRRKFIQQTILGISGSALLPVIGHASSGPMTSMATANAPLQIGMAGYSFAKFSFIYFATFALRKVRGQYLRDSLEISSDDRLEIFYRGIYKPAVILLGVTFFCGGLKYDGAAIYELVLNLLPFEGTHGYFGG